MVAFTGVFPPVCTRAFVGGNPSSRMWISWALLHSEVAIWRFLPTSFTWISPLPMCAITHDAPSEVPGVRQRSRLLIGLGKCILIEIICCFMEISIPNYVLSSQPPMQQGLIWMVGDALLNVEKITPFNP